MEGILVISKKFTTEHTELTEASIRSPAKTSAPAGYLWVPPSGFFGVALNLSAIPILGIFSLCSLCSLW
jgi:hypothetical protein